MKTIVGGGAVLGALTALGVTAFALLSRSLSPGVTETSVQLALVWLGCAVAAFMPAYRVQPREVDTIAWAALVGLLGALTFTVIDTVVLRPLNLYHWTWDEIGGGSGFWYVPVWWMLSATLAWLGSWVAAARQRAGAGVVADAVGTIGIAAAVLGVLTVAGVTPFGAASGALAFGIALVLHVPIALMRRGA